MRVFYTKQELLIHLEQWVLYEGGTAYPSRAAGFTPSFLCGCVFCICFVLCPVHVCTMLLVSLDCQFVSLFI